MKRFTVLFLSFSLIVVILCCSFPASALSSDPSYTKDAISYFNSQYNTLALNNFGVFPRSLTGENTKLNGFYPVFIAQESRGYIFFGRSFVYEASEGFLKITLYNAFSYVFSSVSAVEVSDIKVPDTLVDKISFSYSYESGAVRDQFGYVSYFLYLPTADDVEDKTGFTVYNNFKFPVEGDYPVPEPETSEIEITYEPQFSMPDLNYQSAEELVSFDTDNIEDVLDIPGALESLDSDIFDAGNGFKSLFLDLSNSFALTPVLILLLVIAIGLAVIGRI